MEQIAKHKKIICMC